jgi:hypothetical protein
MTALVRYLVADTLRAERWAAPALLFLAATAAFNAGGGSALSCYGFTAAVLLPVATWLTVVVRNGEDPVQVTITTVTVGSALRVQLATLLTAALGCVPLAAVALVWAPVAGNPGSAGDVVAGVLAHAVTATAGGAFGAVLSRPVTDRLSWAVCGGTALVLLELAAPVPPLRPLLVLLAADHPAPFPELAGRLLLVAAETAALAAALVAVAYRIGRRRS